MNLLMECYYWLNHAVVQGEGVPLFSTGCTCGYLRLTTPWSFSHIARK